MPYLWILFLGIFVFIVYYNLKHTKTGYRYQIWFVIMIAILASMFLGSLFSLAGWGEKLDEVLEAKAPYYGEMMNPHLDFWSNPEEGRLVGIVSEMLDDGSLSLIDKDRKEWNVEIVTEEIKMPIATGLPIRILGEKKSASQFKAKKILPMMPGRGFFKHMGPRPGINNNMIPPPPMGDPRMKKIF
jgi:hypothetical protein